jgi:hypothetical protein
LANKEHKFRIKGIELCKKTQRKKCQVLWPDKKRRKNEKKEIVDFLEKEKK